MECSTRPCQPFLKVKIAEKTLIVKGSGVTIEGDGNLKLIKRDFGIEVNIVRLILS